MCFKSKSKYNILYEHLIVIRLNNIQVRDEQTYMLSYIDWTNY